jgi:sulfoxide reductase catalytic subunit YedY
MALPWVGFPMKDLIAAVEPTSKAKFVRLLHFYDAKITTGPGFHLGSLPWPYQEGLRLDEMANELALFCDRYLRSRTSQATWCANSHGFTVEIWI